MYMPKVEKSLQCRRRQGIEYNVGIVCTPLVRESGHISMSPYLTRAIIRLPSSRCLRFSEGPFTRCSFVHSYRRPLRESHGNMGRYVLIVKRSSSSKVLIHSSKEPCTIFLTCLAGTQRFLHRRVRPYLRVRTGHVRRLIRRFASSTVGYRSRNYCDLRLSDVHGHTNKSPVSIGLFTAVLSRQSRFSVIRVGRSQVCTCLSVRLTGIRRPPSIHHLAGQRMAAVLTGRRL